VSRHHALALVRRAILTLGLAFVPGIASAVPPLLNYQGFVTDDQAQPMTGNHAMRFEMYGDSTGGSPLWSETYAAVAVNAGIFNVLLGSVTPLPVGTLFTGAQLWLETSVDGTPLLPRRPIVSVAYAILAGQVEPRMIPRAQGYLGDNTDNGALATRTLTLTKRYPATGVRVAWSDNFRVMPNNRACRWEVLFNGSPCPNPGPIAIDMYEGNTNSNRHDPASMFGTCYGLPAGTVQVTTRVGPSPGYPVSDCYTGWNNQLWSLEAEEVQ
jgi:hypothetical protein